MKRTIFNSVVDATGITSYRWRGRPPGLYCFNFHRVGNDDGSAFHPNIYSCTGPRFAELVESLKASFEMVGIDRVVELIESNRPPDRRYGLITFDDGYIDNYDVAFKILRRADCPAVFFLPTDLIGSRDVPWWDRIAWRVAHLGDGTLRVPGSNEVIRVTKAERKQSISKILRIIKESSAIPVLEKVIAIEAQVDCPDIRESGLPLFVSWDQVREMRRGGMWFGSHTRSHQILSHLTEAEQFAELAESKRELEQQLGEHIDALAYPLGGLETYTEFTRRAAEATGFRLAFNFIAGININPAARRYEIQRLSVGENMNVRELRRLVAFAQVR